MSVKCLIGGKVAISDRGAAVSGGASHRMYGYDGVPVIKEWIELHQ